MIIILVDRVNALGPDGLALILDSEELTGYGAVVKSRAERQDQT